jgi:hydrogenase maturation protease
MIRSAFALVGLILAFAGMGLFIAIGIWIWSVKAEVNRQTEALSGRANKTLNSAHDAIEVVREIIEKAENDLAATRLEMLTQAPPAINPVIRSAARGASQNLVGSVDRAHGAIVIASEAVVVADAALNVVGDDLELKKMFNLKPEQLDATRTALGKVSSDLLQAKDILGPPTDPSMVPTFEQLYAVDDALRQARGFTDEVCKVVESTRTRVNETKQKVDLWACRGAVGTSAIAAFGVLGQFFMARFFWRLLRRQSA